MCYGARMPRITCEHKHTNMHSNKNFQLSSLVLFSSKKSDETRFLFHNFLVDAVPNVVFCLPDLFHRYNRICEDFKFLTNVCHKHDVF